MQIAVQGTDSVDIQNLTLLTNSCGTTCGGSFYIADGAIEDPYPAG